MGRTPIHEVPRESNAMAQRSPAAQEFGRIASREGLQAAPAWQKAGGR